MLAKLDAQLEEEFNRRSVEGLLYVIARLLIYLISSSNPHCGRLPIQGGKNAD